MNQQKLDLFGESIIAARDNSISDYMCYIDGKMRGETADLYAKMSNSLSTEQRIVLKKFICSCVDNTIFHTLHALSDNLDGFSVGLKLDSESNYESLSETDDELAGYLVGEDGWIVEYGEYPYVGWNVISKD